MTKLPCVFLFCTLCIFPRNVESVVPGFNNAKKIGDVTTSQVTEASGLAASRRHPGILYTMNDSGGSATVIAIDANTGKRIASLTINNAENADWEDIAVGPCHGDKYCIYVADTGERGGRGAVNIIYRIMEPAIMENMAVDADSQLQFSWDQHDAETLLVDNQGEVYVVSKVQNGGGKFAQLPSSAWGTGQSVAVTSSVILPITTDKRDPVGGDISPSGDEILIKAREHVYYWKKNAGESYADTVVRAPSDLPYKQENQGESVCWSVTASGYYTLDEGVDQPLYYYVRQ